MVNISKVDDSTIKFTFTDNDRYLYNGEISLPLNSLILELDASDMVIFKKIDGDVFVTFLISNSNFDTKEDLEEFYATSMVGSTGGGGDITSGEVQTMIDESISGKADTSAVTESINAAVSGKADISDIPDVSNYFDGAEYDSGTTRINFYHGNTVKAYIDASAFIVDGMVDDVRIETISGVTYLVIDFNTASGKEDIQIPITDIFDASNYYNKSEIDSIESGLKNSIDEKLDASAYTPTDLSEYWTSAQTETAISNATSGKADTSAVTESINAAVSGKVDTTDFATYSGTVETALSGKVDTSAITSSVTSASTDSQVPTAKAVWEATSGGGTTYSAGTNISIDSANTISCTLPIISSYDSRGPKVMIGYNNQQNINYYVKGNYGVSIGFTNYINAERSVCLGTDNQANGYASVAANAANSALTAYSFACGNRTKTTNKSEHASGQYNNSVSASTTFGNSGNTLFSVGNGTADNARHNAFEIRQNGDIYCSDGTNDVKLQDTITATAANTSALGGLKLVKLTQAQYDALAPNYDNNTLYVIKD